MFVGRTAELKFLEHYYEQDGSRILVVYGQRGVGKTALLRKFTEKKVSVTYVARSCSDREQRYQWACELESNGVEIAGYPEYSEIFQQISSEFHEKKLVFVIDEFHYIAKNNAAFLEQLVDYMNHASEAILFVLCTSAAGWVENSMVGRFGSAALSISGLLKVREMHFEEIVKCFPGFDKKAYIENYAVLGGMPGLWNCFTPEWNTRDNIIQNVLTKESRLYNELSTFMFEELRELAVYNTILAAMARGCNKLNDIHRHTGFSRAKISVYLKNLMELELVEKVFSFDLDDRGDTQKGIYRISNPFVRFYFRFLFPNGTLLKELEPEAFYRAAVEAVFPEYVEEAYRRICREEIGSISKSVGEWLGKAGTLDVVSRERDGSMVVANCSYSRQMGIEDYEWLTYCAAKAKISNAVLCLYSEVGFDAKLQQIAAQNEVELCSINME
ncbi:MAG: ATP-binding protein [Lachnospiraceae bacterium]|nr:ATP-binding protein [Lachnospiraceae bacterium]